MLVRSMAASRTDIALTQAHRSMTSPFFRQRLSKQQNRFLSRLTLKVRQRASPPWRGQGPLRWAPWPALAIIERRGLGHMIANAGILSAAAELGL